MTSWLSKLISGAEKTESVKSPNLNTPNQSASPKKVVIPLSEQKWVPQTINPSDYTSTSGLRKHYPISEYRLETLPKELIESNGGAGTVFMGGKEITLDELTMYSSYSGAHGAVGIKHTENGDEIYISETKKGHTITAKYVNGELSNVEKISSNTLAGIMPWC